MAGSPLIGNSDPKGIQQSPAPIRRSWILWFFWRWPATALLIAWTTLALFGALTPLFRGTVPKPLRETPPWNNFVGRLATSIELENNDPTLEFAGRAAIKGRKPQNLPRLGLPRLSDHDLANYFNILSELLPKTEERTCARIADGTVDPTSRFRALVNVKEDRVKTFLDVTFWAAKAALSAKESPRAGILAGCAHGTCRRTRPRGYCATHCSRRHVCAYGSRLMLGGADPYRSVLKAQGTI